MATTKAKTTKKSTKSIKKTKDKVVKSVDINKDEIILDIKEELTAKVKSQITKDIIDDVKNDVSILVKEEVRNDLKKEIDREIKKSNSRVLRGRRGKILFRDLVIIILLVIIGFLIYYMYNHNYIGISINTSTNNVSVSNDKKVVKNKQDYSYLLDMTNVKIPFDNTNSLYLYNGTYNETNINDSIKLTMAFNLVNKNEFTTDELKDAYIKLFGTDKHFKNTSFEYECKKFKYDVDANTYTLISDECINQSDKEIIEKIIDIKDDKDSVIITTVMGVYDNSDKSLYNFKNIYTPVAVDLNTNFDLTDYKDKLNTYKYTFKKDDNDYHFESITNKNI